MVQEWDRRIGAHLQCTTVHHPATPTVENLGMARWYRSGIEELEPIYSAQQCTIQPHLQLRIWDGCMVQEWDRRIGTHFQRHQPNYQPGEILHPHIYISTSLPLHGTSFFFSIKGNPFLLYSLYWKTYSYTQFLQKYARISVVLLSRQYKNRMVKNTVKRPKFGNGPLVRHPCSPIL